MSEAADALREESDLAVRGRLTHIAEVVVYHQGHDHREKLTGGSGR